jgi:hypothetical protein
MLKDENENLDLLTLDFSKLKIVQSVNRGKNIKNSNSVNYREF